MDTGPVDDITSEISSDQHEPTGAGIPAMEDDAPSRKPDDRQAIALGVVTGDMVIQTMIAFGGDAWAPKAIDGGTYDERGNLQDAFGAYFRAKGIEDIPPGLGLTIALCAYALPRFGQEETTGAAKKLGGMIKRGWRKLRKRTKESDDAQLDTGPNGIGED